MGKVAFMFPGQGAQYVGMGKDFYESFADSRAIYEQASKVLGFSMEELCFEENDKLDMTEYTQAAMVTTSIAILKQVEKAGIQADVTAGLSLGEYCALVAGGVMSFEDAVKVVRERGILMQDTVPVGQGAMAAVLAFDQKRIEEICEETEGIVTIANYNCPGQIVISGETESVKKASERLKEAGAKRVVPLNVSGPFHSMMLKEAEEKLLTVLEGIEVKDPAIPYVSNTIADFVTQKEQVKDLLGRQVYSSVRWQQSIEKMIEDGVDTFIEIGPGKTLSGFMRKINRKCKTINIETVADLEKLAALKEELGC